MYLLVPGEMGAPCVALPTLHAFIGLLSRVSSQVSNEVDFNYPHEKNYCCENCLPNLNN